MLPSYRRETASQRTHRCSNGVPAAQSGRGDAVRHQEHELWLQVGLAFPTTSEKKHAQMADALEASGLFAFESAVEIVDSPQRAPGLPPKGVRQVREPLRDDTYRHMSSAEREAEIARLHTARRNRMAWASRTLTNPGGLSKDERKGARERLWALPRRGQARVYY